MARNLMRTSYSTIVYEIRDFGLESVREV